MSLFAIGDPHLSFGCQKPMDIFRGWENHADRLSEHWRRVVSDEDTVVLPGDISWAMNLESLLPDLQFLNQLPGKKVLLKGNHDYWWTTKQKMEQYLHQNGLDRIAFLHNNCICAEGFRLCGTRGWLFENGQPQDEKVLAREAGGEPPDAGYFAGIRRQTGVLRPHPRTWMRPCAQRRVSRHCVSAGFQRFFGVLSCKD